MIQQPLIDRRPAHRRGTPQPPTAYQILKAEAARLGWPTIYKTDLTKHDRATLARADAPTEFGWHIRPTGTDLYRPGSQAALDWLKANRHVHGAEVDNPSRFRWYYYRNGTLEPVSYDTLVARLEDSLSQEEHPR